MHDRVQFFQNFHCHKCNEVWPECFEIEHHPDGEIDPFEIVCIILENKDKISCPGCGHKEVDEVKSQ